MNPEQQQIAIAEAHGRVQRPDGSWFPIGKDYGSAGIPNYPFDLNAMHEVEKVLTNEQLEVYCNILHKPNHGVYWAIHSTASQRAEAFLRTIGKWKECK